MFYPQSKGSWWGDEVQARYIEGRRAVHRKENRLHWDTVHSAENREFPEDKGIRRYGNPSEREVRKWEKENPNFPEDMRRKGFLSDLEPLEYQPVGRVNRAQTLVLPTVPRMGWGVWPYAAPQPAGATQNGVAPMFAALMSYMMACVVLAIGAALTRMVISSL